MWQTPRRHEFAKFQEEESCQNVIWFKSCQSPHFHWIKLTILYPPPPITPSSRSCLKRRGSENVSGVPRAKNQMNTKMQAGWHLWPGRSTRGKEVGKMANLSVMIIPHIMHFWPTDTWNEQHVKYSGRKNTRKISVTLSSTLRGRKRRKFVPPVTKLTQGLEVSNKINR